MTHRGIVPLLLASTAALACGGDPGQPTPNGVIEVTTVTGGEPLDPDGYTIALDEGPATDLGVNSRSTCRCSSRRASLELAGVAPHCRLSGPNPRPVTVDGGSTVRVRLELVCSTPSGSIELMATTTGESPDPDGYTVSLDGGTVGPSPRADDPFRRRDRWGWPGGPDGDRPNCRHRGESADGDRGE